MKNYYKWVVLFSLLFIIGGLLLIFNYFIAGIIFLIISILVYIFICISV